jgi:hypothetical protein
MEHKKITVVVMAAVTSLLLAGTILAPIQSFAAGSRGGFPDTSSLKHAVRDGVTVNLEHRDQHMNQENLCYRTNTCRQSDVGQNTLGNDNSITGFADQSDNIQQAAAPLTPTGNQTTNQTGGGGGNVNCVTLTISGVSLESFVPGTGFVLLNQTRSIQACLIPDVASTVDIPGIGLSIVVLSTDGCGTSLTDTGIRVGTQRICASVA